MMIQLLSSDVVKILSDLLNPDRRFRASIAEVMVTSAWMECERAKEIPETCSVVFAQKMSRPTKAEACGVLCLLPIQRESQSDCVDSHKNVVCFFHFFQDSPKTAIEPMVTFRRRPSDVPLSADVHANAFVRFGKFLKQYFGHSALPQSPTPYSANFSPSMKGFPCNSRRSPTAAPPSGDYISCDLDRKDDKKCSSKFSFDLRSVLEKPSRTGRHCGHIESDLNTKSPPQIGTAKASFARPQICSSLDALPYLSMSPRIEKPASSRESPARDYSDTSAKKSSNLNISFSPVQSFQGSQSADKMPKVEAKPETPVASFQDEFSKRESFRRSLPTSSQKDSSLSSHSSPIFQTLLGQERSLLSDISKLRKVHSLIIPQISKYFVF
jgi:hypothetical protein